MPTDGNRPPRLRDVVTSRAGLEPYEQRPGVVTDLQSTGGVYRPADATEADHPTR
ncbi:hypothetical protein QLQ12_21450 [Actinoplanes sp. NEAU-A12]|uniref:Uncharacterized protein n=1 Tax=Actinoplanes sandaracinus TaxID=3045177 RepID=A0ABT6WN71_9ACTN|nr:hypothetical protein [Actinoplanes sandaracinus]MDI6101184.1 hypothetical protein [Actinoplanes sandaracinus]